MRRPYRRDGGHYLLGVTGFEHRLHRATGFVVCCLLIAACSTRTTVEQTGQQTPRTGLADGERTNDTAGSESLDSAADDGTHRSGEAAARSTGESADAEASIAITIRPDRPAAPNGMIAPLVATDAASLAADIEAAERVLRDSNATPEDLATWGHIHQISIRKLAREPTWTFEVLTALPESLRATITRHLTAREEIGGLVSGYDRADIVPAWEIIEPEPPATLLAHYAEAEAATGIDWEYLAAINLMETGFGRIRGLSSAGAQGPMQFIPTTWDEVGEGDVNDPRDAIAAAARYLVRRGGPDDMDAALWGYNNSDYYVEAVKAYADILRDDPAAFTGLWNWQIYFTTSEGEIWLPPGYLETEALDVADHIAQAPWSAPDPALLAPQ